MILIMMNPMEISRSDENSEWQNKLTKFGLGNMTMGTWVNLAPEKREQNIHVMEQLEQEIPGSVKFLNEKYGIEEFRRYPAALLLQQVAEEESQLPYGLIVFPKADHNDIYADFQPQLEELSTKSKNRYALKIAEVGSQIELAKQFSSLNQKYGEVNKIGYLVVGGHGTEHGEGLILGPYDGKVPKEINPNNSNVIWGKDAVSGGFRKVNQEYLDPDAEVVLLSCCTGVPGGIAESVAVAQKGMAMGPTIPVQIHSLAWNISFDEHEKIHFRPVFQGEPALTGTYNHKVVRPEESDKRIDSTLYF